MRADDYLPLDPDQLTYWSKFPNFHDELWFPGVVGLQVEELRQDYARMSVPFKRENLQPHGVIHGGVLATMIDTVVVPAIGSTLPRDAQWSTIELHVQYHRPLTSDAVTEGWVVKRGRTICFTRAEVVDDQGRLVASGTATYSVRLPSTDPARTD